MKRKVILVTDGDRIAQRAVEIAAQKIGGRSISVSAGNPTTMTGEEIVEMVKQAPYDPVVVMVDDCGNPGKGKGEEAMIRIIQHPDIEVLGVIAVASNTFDGEGYEIDESITSEGNITQNAVDKYGNEKDNRLVVGDTLSVLQTMDVPVVIGIGDPGKMNNRDSIKNGAEITTKALEEILKRTGYCK